MTITIEQQLADLIHKHGLISLSLTAHDTVDGVEFYSSAQAEGGDINGRWCGSTDSWCDKAGAAIAQAIDDLNAKRSTSSAPLAPIEGLEA